MNKYKEKTDHEKFVDSMRNFITHVKDPYIRANLEIALVSFAKAEGREANAITENMETTG